MRKMTNFYQSIWGSITLLLISLLFQNSAAQTYTAITSGSLVKDFGGYLGTAWGDYDNDGNVDLFVANFQQINLLFHNEGNGKFTKITTGDVFKSHGVSFGGTWGDYDNDGYLDLFVVNEGSEGFLFHNEQGTLKRVGASDFSSNLAKSHSASWGDYDNDGYLDLFIANDGASNYLYRNNGNSTFTKITSGSMVKDVARSVVGLWADYDNDNDLDLFVVNGYFAYEKNALYRNEGQGNFTKITTGVIVTDVEGSTGGSWGDYDNDGDLDLYVCNSVNNAPNSLYRNNGDESFSKIGFGLMVTEMGHSVGSSWIDYDNDGDLDLFVVNVLGQKNCLYRNDGGDIFTKITTGAIVNDMSWSYGCSWADYDNDGDQDVIVTNGGFYTTKQNFFYQNDGSSANWLKVKCVGASSNKSAIGARVQIKATIYNRTYWQMREITGQSSFLGQNSLNAEFGLGNASLIDSLVIRWPGGKKQVLTQVTPNQFLTVAETSSVSAVAEPKPVMLAGYRLDANYPNPFNPRTNIRFALPRAAQVTLKVFDLTGKAVAVLVDGFQEAGEHQVVFNAQALPSDLYFYQLQTEGFSQTRKLMLVK
ncbi:FG-GAP-like repeat-containing protein [candidate division KSB1 bacterium]|nr:FG-GAP-like repeat-containing protein [candidate division KSB1 bacterium]